MTQGNETITMPVPNGNAYEIGNDKPLTILAGPCAICLLYTSDAADE